MRTMRSRPYYNPYHMDLWRVRKINGKWWIWKPREILPAEEFDTFPYGWKP